MVLLLALLPGLAFGQCSDTSEVTELDSSGTQAVLDQFGYAIATGNFNGDSRDDLAVAVVGEDIGGVVNTGLVAVHYGGSASYDRWSQSTISNAANETDDFFGETLAVGDFNDDGYDDLVVGIPLEDESTSSDTGRVAVRYGDSGGLDSSNPSQSFSQADVAGNGNDDGDEFGSALAVGDFDGDGYDDLAIGVPFDDVSGTTDSGRVVIVYGTFLGLAVSSSETIHQSNFGESPEIGDQFASALAAGDFDGDGYDDLAIGVPGEDRSSLTDVGWVHVKFGDAVGLKDSATSVTFGHSAIGATDRDGDHLGQRLAAGYVGNDAYADLVAGIPLKNMITTVDAGMVGVLFGGSSPSDLISGGDNLQTNDFGQTNTSGSEFGWSVLVADLDADGDDEVIAGSPEWSAAEGAIGVFFPGAIDDFEWVDEYCMGGVSVNAEYFGRVLAAGDFDGDARNELAVGDPTEGTLYGAVRIGTVSP